MSSSSSNVFQYGPLPKAGFIRLLSFEDDDDTINNAKPQNPRCQLQNHDLHGGQGSYIALSYVWGSDARDCAITCNGATMAITTSAFEAIEALRKYAPQALLWIDGVCINQDNDTEKASQVSQMAEIYSFARRVAVWLGSEANDSDRALEAFDRLAEALPKLPWRVDLDDYYSHDGFPDRSHPMWAALGHLYVRPWFHRLWTFQEVVLARSLFVACGKQIVTWEKFLEVSEQLHRLGLGRIFSRGNSTSRNYTALGAILDMEKERKRYREWGFLTTYDVITFAVQKMCKLPIDRIYAMRSLSPEHMRRDVAVDYTLTASQAYVMYGKACLKGPRGLEYLSLVCHGWDMPSRALPSWCVDLGQRPPFEPLTPMFRAGTQAEDNVNDCYSEVFLGPSIDYIRVRGFMVDRVAAIVRCEFSWEAATSEERLMVMRNISRWNTECEELCTDMKDDVDALWPHICAVTLNIASDSDPNIVKQAYKDVLQNVKSRLETDDQDMWEPPADRLSPFKECADRMKWACESRAYFRTEKGRVGVGAQSAQPGDNVVVFYGASPVFILREVADSGVAEENFLLVGDAFVHGLMDLKDTRNGEVGETRMFKIV
jgi:hypothetical protein